MPSFSYKGIDSSGATVTGTLEASDRRSALKRLSVQKIQPLSVEAQSDRGSRDVLAETHHDFFQQKAAAGEEQEKKSRRRLIPKSKRGVSLDFLQNLLMLLQSGLPLGDALRLLHARLSDPQQKEIAGELWKRISEGRTLASAMGDFPQFFSESNSHLISAGEASGNLVPVLDRIVAYLNEMRQLQRQLLGSLAYPAFVVIMAFGVVVFFLMFLLPRVRSMLETLGGEMQLVATLLIGGSDALVRFGPFIALGLLLAVIGISRWRKNERGRILTDRWLLKLPVVGNIYLYNNIFRVSSLLSTLLQSGVNTTEALRLVERTVGNTLLRAKFAAARKMIQEGVSMSTAFRRVDYMPDLAMDILTVGENTGSITNSLININNIYRDELSRRLNILTTSISTAALFFAFSLVGLIALSIVFSVMEISKSLTA